MMNNEEYLVIYDNSFKGFRSESDAFKFYTKKIKEGFSTYLIRKNLLTNLEAIFNNVNRYWEVR